MDFVVCDTNVQIKKQNKAKNFWFWYPNFLGEIFFMAVYYETVPFYHDMLAHEMLDAFW